MASESERSQEPERGPVESEPRHTSEHEAPERGKQERPTGFWDGYWERFRRQQVDDPVEGNREGYWDRFRRQQVDDPVDERRRRGRSS